MTVALANVTKRFGAFTAVDAVSLDIEPGSVHALLGANGSGKSTLVRMVTGVYPLDGGEIRIDGSPVSSGWTPAAAAAAGIRVVHQEAPLVDNLSIAESVALFSGYPRTALGTVRWRRLWATTQAILDELHIPRRARDLANRLTGAERAMLAVELAVRTAGDELRLLVLDEATAALPEAEATPFLELVRSIADRGCPVLMVTHRLGELKYADRLTLIDAGRVVIEDDPAKVDRADLIAAMRGAGEAASALERSAEDRLSALWSGGRAARDVPTGIILEARELVGGTVEQASFDLQAGEILGVVGVRGEGMEDLPRLVAGAQPLSSGAVTVGGARLRDGFTPRDALDAGIGFLPADRLHEGGIAGLPMRENAMLPDVGGYWHRAREEKRGIARLISYLDVRPRDPRTVFGRMSGGNQQKVILGRLLRMRPNVLVLADPSYGVDPAAREIMFDAIRDARAAGIGVILTSTEPEQLAGLCDRVLVMQSGRIHEELSGADLTAADLMAKVL